jgi:dihydropteroate synthase
MTNKPKIMGIINVTPDSFSGDRTYNVLKKIEKCINDGADIIDIGGESTRPGAIHVSLEEEIRRIIPAIEIAQTYFPQITLSIDTRKQEIANMCCERGVHIINDVSGELDTSRYPHVHIVIMHYVPHGTYVKSHDVFSILQHKAKMAQERGIPFEHIILDPGIGFGIKDNIELIQRLGELKPYRILLGASLKSFLSKSFSGKNLEPQERLGGSIAAHLVGALRGANILRVHHVFEMRQAIDFLNFFY